MSVHPSLLVARMHGVLVTRPHSDVFHVYSGTLTPSGRCVPRAARTVCTARTRRLSVAVRSGAAVDLAGRRMCARCSARLFAIARRAEQPISRDDCLAFYRGITLADLVVAIALATSVDETHAIGFVLGLLFGPAPVRRPAEFGGRQALFDVHTELLRVRRHLRNTERSPEEIEAAARKREADLERDAQILAGRRQAAQLDRAVERRSRNQFLMPHERELLAQA